MESPIEDDGGDLSVIDFGAVLFGHTLYCRPLLSHKLSREHQGVLPAWWFGIWWTVVNQLQQ